MMFRWGCFFAVVFLRTVNSLVNETGKQNDGVGIRRPPRRSLHPTSTVTAVYRIVYAPKPALNLSVNGIRPARQTGPEICPFRARAFRKPGGRGTLPAPTTQPSLFSRAEFNINCHPPPFSLTQCVHSATDTLPPVQDAHE